MLRTTYGTYVSTSYDVISYVLQLIQRALAERTLGIYSAFDEHVAETPWSAFEFTYLWNLHFQLPTLYKKFCYNICNIFIFKSSLETRNG